MSLSNVYQALRVAYLEGNFFTSAKTEFENLAFTPPTAEAWASFYFVPSQPVVATLGTRGDDRYDGFVQIDLNYPLNSGANPVRAMGDSITNRFTAGRRFSYSGQEVVIVSCGCSQGRVVNSFYRVSVTVVFYAFVTRQN